MKIEHLYIDGYKNLFGFEVYFESRTSLLALAGKNGSGKSNALEAVAKIFAFIMTEGEVPGFTFSIQYSIHGDTVVVENITNSLKISKNGKAVSKSQQHSIIPLTLFLYYAGETERLRSLSDKTVDKVFDRCIKSGETPSYKSISYLSVNDFGLSLMVTRCYGLSKSKVLEDILGIESIAKRCKLHFIRPSWGKRGAPENFWNAQGYVKEIIELLTHVGVCEVINSDEFIISLPDCEALRDDLSGPEGLFKDLKILSQAGVLSKVEIDVIKDGASFDCNELSEGEKQLGNLLMIIDFTREYSALFLLDEFDSYLHPSWQRIFAELIHNESIAGQIIFTTHSPLTLSQMKSNNVFLLRSGKIYESSIDPFNRDVSEIMEELMDVSLRPENILDLINDFNKHIATKNLSAAKQTRGELAGLLSVDDPFFITADISIARIDRR